MKHVLKIQVKTLYKRIVLLVQYTACLVFF